MSDQTDEILQPISLQELHELRRKILHEDFEPDVETLRRAVQAVCVARPLPEEKPAKPRKKRVDVDLGDLL